MKPSEARQFRAKLDGLIDVMDDETALDNTVLFPEWVSGRTYYGPGDPDHPQSKVQYNGLLYKCAQGHTSQDDWTPDITPALWTRVSVEEWPEWIQPTGAQDAYRLGAKVSHNGKHWTSDIDYNTYEPSVYGWTEV